MKLNEKITSYEQYIEVMESGVAVRNGNGEMQPVRRYLKADGGLAVPLTHMYTFNDHPTGLFDGHTQVTRVPPQLWWVHREMMRMAFGVYRPLTKPLASLAMTPLFQQFYAHISNEDETLIAFTASREDGERDRQTKMALGRFIRKHYLAVSDKMVAAIEAAHRVEVNPPVEFIVGLGNEKEFVRGYCAVNSCMSKGIREYGVDQIMHPVEAYCTPGFQLAILRNASGQISARSLVWINPDDANDKRMVRTYGDVVLHQFLLNKGFRLDSFEGAYVKAVQVPGHRDGGRERFVMPYIDTGGDGSGRVPTNAFAVWDGADKFYLFGSKATVKMSTEFRASIQNAAGNTYARAFPINRKCAITGVPINGLKDAFVEVWHGDKQDVALPSATKGWLTLTRDFNTRATLWHAPETPYFKHGAVHYVDTHENRIAMGFRKLHPTFYPDSTEWMVLGAPDTMSHTEGYLLKTEDTVQVISSRGMSVRHVSELKKTDIRVASIGDIKTFMAEGTSHVRTADNRIVVPGQHPVKQAYDGQWYYAKKLRQVNLFSDKIWIPIDKELKDIEFKTLPKEVCDRIDVAVASVNQLPNAKKKALFATFARMGDMLCPIREGKGDALVANYLFDYRDMPIKLVEGFLAKPFVCPEGAQPATMEMLHRFGGMVIARVNEIWAAKAASPKADEVPAPVAATV